jgi:hypothetical protein
MSIAQVLQKFKADALARGVSENFYFTQLVIEAHNGNTDSRNKLEEIRDSSTDPKDVAFFQEIIDSVDSVNNVINVISGATGIGGGGSGTQGETGVQGSQGIQGETGVQGPAGSDGIGIPGANGSQGETGVQGATGPSGGGGGGGGTVISDGGTLTLSSYDGDVILEGNATLTQSTTTIKGNLIILAVSTKSLIGAGLNLIIEGDVHNRSNFPYTIDISGIAGQAGGAFTCAGTVHLCGIKANGGEESNGGNITIGSVNNKESTSYAIQANGGGASPIGNAGNAGQIQIRGNYSGSRIDANGGAATAGDAGDGGNGGGITIDGDVTMGSQDLSCQGGGAGILGGYNSGHAGTIQVRGDLVCGDVYARGGFSSSGAGGNGGYFVVSGDVVASGTIWLNGGDGFLGGNGRVSGIDIRGSVICNTFKIHGGDSLGGNNNGGNAATTPIIYGGITCTSSGIEAYGGDANGSGTAGKGPNQMRIYGGCNINGSINISDGSGSAPVGNTILDFINGFFQVENMVMNNRADIKTRGEHCLLMMNNMSGTKKVLSDSSAPDTAVLGASDFTDRTFRKGPFGTGWLKSAVYVTA